MHSRIPRHRVSLAVVVAALVLARSIAFSQVQHIALVLDIDGMWHLGDSSQKLGKWDGLPAGAHITAAPENAKNARIVILYQDNTRGTCEYKEGCTRLPVEKSLSESSLADRLKVALNTLFRVRELLHRDPDRYALLGSRGEEVRDAVVELNAATVDLTPAFRHIQPGDYVVRLRAINRADSPPLEPVSFRWKPGRPLTVTVTRVTPGLYELRLMVRRYGQLEDTGQHAWVLLTTMERFAATSESFAQAVEVTDRWGPDVDREVVRSFLRAYLEQLATSETK